MRQTRLMTKRARSLRRKLTDAERKLWYALRAHRLAGLSFRRQAPCGPFIADFLCAEAWLVVEVDGATHSTEEEIAYDRRRDEWFAANGYRLLRVTNSEIYRSLDGVCETIVSAAHPRFSTHT
ncbi:endonuclease domain-containing protein [Methylosinus sp. H3A]|uniref:endonuclease domain-containing protein n=1 Tax=Methylosinus sp. H3A TaxID=2785786 RepID=UPI0018C1E315|nr:endonuclease domain-containing protein [Methylosinus sp. H3A]MBG0812171.1 endonuclease domain-containing protein [Methylosinus sp. H3A]